MAATGRRVAALIQVWRHRDDPIFLPGAVEALAGLCGGDGQLLASSRHAPQLVARCGHPPETPELVLEHYLRLCESTRTSRSSYPGCVRGDGGQPAGLVSRPTMRPTRERRLLQSSSRAVCGAKMVNRDSLRSAAFAHNVLPGAAPSSEGGRDAAVGETDQGLGRWRRALAALRRTPPIVAPH